MIAVDTNVVVRCLVADHPTHAKVARERLAELSTDRPGFISPEVILGAAQRIGASTVWTFDRSMGRLDGVSLLDATDS